MTTTLRPLDPETDLHAIMDLVNTTYLEPVTLEVYRSDRDDERAQKNILQETVAADDSGAIVGYGEIKRKYGEWDRGRIQLWVITVSERRGQGIGTLLYEAGMSFAREYGAEKIDSSVRDDDAVSLGFAERRGFHIDRHMFGSRLDVAEFDETPFVEAIETAEATGIRFFSMADLGNAREAQRKFYELNKYVDSEVPGERLFPSFEEFSKMVYQSEWYRADGQIIAADGDRWVGMSAVGHFPEHDNMEVMITGVDSAYRGRKIGMALKVLTHRCAKRYGVKYIVTGNDTHNAPMLAINEKLGYKRMRGTYHLQKIL
jgi:RimJ/RimL family protein N-acetyltransferase